MLIRSLPERCENSTAWTRWVRILTGDIREVSEETYVDGTGWPDNIGNVGHRGTGGSTEIEHLGAGLHVDRLQTAKNTGSKLTPAVSCQYVYIGCRGGLTDKGFQICRTYG
jgi:hypothetical protein